MHDQVVVKINQTESARDAAQAPTVEHHEFLRAKPRDLKTLLGIFYTPAPLAEMLVDWAVTDPRQLIMEPSFGGCGFLNAIARRLTDLDHHQPWQQIYGCDKDPRAFTFLPKNFQINEPVQFRLGDFLTLLPAHFERESFDVVLGNPPYVSRHTMTATQIAICERAIKNGGYSISSRASLWAYFVLHGLRFLRAGGKIAWVLPRSLSQSIYGRDLLQILLREFAAVTVISLGQRMFKGAGTEEITDVLLATDYHHGKTIAGQMRHVHADSLSALLQLLVANTLPIAPVDIGAAASGPSRIVSLTSIQKATLNSLYELPQCHKIGGLINIKIGLVTGASDFFLLRRGRLKQCNLRMSDCAVTISKFRHTSGVVLTDDDAKALRRSEERVLLVKCSQRKMSDRVKRYLKTFPEDLKDKVETFKKRIPWHKLDDHAIPDAFIPCLVRGNPRLVLNFAKLNCTNNVLRVWFKIPAEEISPMLIAVALASTFGQISAEAFGRACGSGGLKIEPSDWQEMKLLLPPSAPFRDVWDAFIEVNRLLRANEADAARQRADQFLLKHIPALAKQGMMGVLEIALTTLQHNRK
jgi:adenine-specific DNA-methyltransferase